MAKEEVRDGFLGDLPEEIQTKVMNIHKIIIDGVNAEFKRKKYDSIRNQQWAKSWLDEFFTMPTDKNHVGSVRVYKKGKRFSCMIQMTGHVTNNRNTDDEELFHGLIRNAHTALRSKIRRKFDITLECESVHGEPFEGYDIWTKQNVAKDIWEKFDDKKTKTVTEVKESVIVSGIEELPYGLQKYIETTNIALNDYINEKSHGSLKYEYRVVADASNGHPIKLVYELNPNNITGSGGGSHVNPDIELRDNLRKNIKKKGYKNPNYEDNSKNYVSKGNKVIAIIDLCNNKRLNEVDAYPPIINLIGDKNSNSSLMPSTINRTLEIYQQFYDDKKLSDIANKLKRECPTGMTPDPGARITIKRYKERGIEPYHYKVGTIDNTNTFKTTRINKTLDNIFNINKSKLKYESTLTEYAIEHFDEIDEMADINSEIGFTVLKKIGEHYEGSIILTPELVCEDVEKTDVAFEYALNKFIDIYEKEYDPTKLLYLRGEENTRFFEYQLTESYARLLYEWMCVNDKANYFESYDEFNLNNPYWVWDPFTESDNTPEYNVDMDEKQAKKTLQTLSQNILNDVEKDEKYKISQYTANIYGNIITKNLLPLWAKGYRKLTINISQNTSNTLEFKIPSMTKDFVSRFVEGRESINGLLHRNPEIKITMSANIFNTMKTPNDAFNFFKAAIKYYDRGIVTYSEKLMAEVMKLNREMKHLISTTKLSGVVTFPIHMLLVFDNVDMSDIKTFMINNEDIKTVNNFIRNIYSRYASPEKEKNKIIEDLNKMIDSFNESCDDIGDGRYLAEAVNDLFTGKFNDEMIKVKEEFIRENVDVNWSRNQKDRDVKFLIEKFGVKKLKKIPRDLIAYISIEAESIQDNNDKLMIASYCLSKIEIVEWYIELLDVGSKKYIVPHTKPELERIHTQLLACYKKIMDVKIKNPNDRPIIDIKYPAGYEG